MGMCSEAYQSAFSVCGRVVGFLWGLGLCIAVCGMPLVWVCGERGGESGLVVIKK